MMIVPYKLFQNCKNMTNLVILTGYLILSLTIKTITF